jgi:hypothetical protein
MDFTCVLSVLRGEKKIAVNGFFSSNPSSPAQDIQHR